MYQANEKRDEIIEKIIAHIKKKLPAKQAQLVCEFTRQYYANLALNDLLTRSSDDWYGVVLSHWNFAAQRGETECKVRVYNPNYAEHHWQSNHTVIEISDKDKPFLVDSTRMAISQAGIGMHLMINLGGIKVARDAAGQIIQVFPKDAELPAGAVSEALIHIEIDKQTDPVILEQLSLKIEHTLADVRIAVEDWAAMRTRVEETIEELEKNPPPFDSENIEESKNFLRWMLDNHFTFLGARDYILTKETLDVVPGTGLGILRDERKGRLSRPLSELAPSAVEVALGPQVLIISKTNTVSTVHRPTHADYIGIKRFDKKGKLIGERRFIGLYTSVAYNSNPSEIPFLRQKVAAIMKRSGFPPKGHAAKALYNIVETLPRDDLFQGSVEELFEMAMGILSLQERSIIRLFVRKDVYGRFISCLVYMPRERVHTDLREAMGKILLHAFGGSEISFVTQFSESILARVHFIIRVNPNIPVTYDTEAIQAKLVDAARSWNDELHHRLIEYYGEEKGNELNAKYGRALPPGYRDDFDPRTAVYDIEYLERLSDKNRLEMNLYRSLDDTDGSVRLRLYQPNHAIPLSDVLPMLENMGLRVLA
ncbi:MAG: NAD-glutamate dehydrogenase, partial [Gammaproteobacteria bacterium]